MRSYRPSHFPLVSVESEAIRAIGYKQGLLIVWFTSGHLYERLMFPRKLYEEWMNAESKGKFFHAHIRLRYKLRCICKTFSEHINNMEVTFGESWRTLATID